LVLKPTEGHSVAILMANIGSGDVSALAALFDRWSPAVYTVVSHALPRTASAGEVDQVVEDVFWQLWQRAGGEAPSMVSLILTSLDRSRARQ
jgi:hypothetical protein